MSLQQFPNSWIITHTGVHFDPLNAMVDMVNIEDIAHALSHICRFNGHTKSFYSVAEHSVHVSKLVPERYAKEALLHDATEAYLMDVCTPLKQRMCFIDQQKDMAYPYSWYEAKLREVIFKRFKLESIGGHISKRIEEMDKRILATEYVQLVNETLPESFVGIRPIAKYTFGLWSPAEAKLVFLQRANQLGIK